MGGCLLEAGQDGVRAVLAGRPPDGLGVGPWRDQLVPEDESLLQGWFEGGRRSTVACRLRSGAVLSLAALDADRLVCQDVTGRVSWLEAQSQLVRLDTVALLATSVARELNDAISVVLGRLEIVTELGGDVTQQGKHLGVAAQHARRIAFSLRNLREVGRHDHRVLPGPFRVQAAVEDAIALLSGRTDQLVLDLPFTLAAAGDQASVARVLAGLLRKALLMTPRAVSIPVRGREVAEGVEVTIGAGRARSSTEPAGGTLVEQVLAEAVGGRLRCVESASGVTWSLVLRPAARVAPAWPEERTLVLVLGSVEVQRAVAEIAEGSPVQVLGATRLEEAEQVLLAQPEVALVLCDLVGDGPRSAPLAVELGMRQPRWRGRVWTLLPVGARPPGLAVAPLPLQAIDLAYLLSDSARS